MKKLNKTTISNIVIITMLSILSFITFSFNGVYVSTIGNDNIIFNGNRDSNKVTLMFNVYWGTEYLDGILTTLDNYNAKTTFFVGGCWVEKELSKLGDIISHGHEIGNHGYFHLDHSTLNYDQNTEEITACHNIVGRNTGIKMALFAPPSGAYNSSTIQAATDLGYINIMWSKDTIDWRDQDSALIYTRATKNLKGGDLILMHPTAKTLEALPAILEYIKINNLEVVPVSNNIGLN